MNEQELARLRSRIRKWEPTPDQQVKVDLCQQSMDYLYSLKPEDMAPYGGKWIAVHLGEIVASASKRADLMKQITHLDRATVVVHRIENRVMVLR